VKRTLVIVLAGSLGLLCFGCSPKNRLAERTARPLTTAPLTVTATSGSPPAPGVVSGGFCTYSKGYLKTSIDVARSLNRYFAAGAAGSEIFHVGGPGNAYTWQKTGNSVTLPSGVIVDGGVAALRQAVGSGGHPGALSQNATNPTDMGTGGILGAQALALKINQGFSEEFITPATGFSGLTLVGMEGVRLDGLRLTSAQASALNGQATLQVRGAADATLGQGTLPYGMSLGQLVELIGLLNDSFESCGPSSFAQSHLYQPYVTSNAFAGRRPSTVSDFAVKPAYNTFSGHVVFVGTGCTSAAYASFPAGAIALIERGTCTFYQKVATAAAAGASAAIIFNSTPEMGGNCPSTPTPGSLRCEALVGMGAAPGSAALPIPAAFVQRSTGLLLRDGAAPVTVTVQQ
jgi:PA domain